MNNTTKGILGEHFVLYNLLKNGFKIIDPSRLRQVWDLIGIDLVLEKEDIVYKIQVKSIIDSKRGCINQTVKEKDEMGYIRRTYDFLILTDLKEMWILPYEFLKRKCPTYFYSKEKLKPFNQNYKLFKMKEEEVIMFLHDNKLANA